MVEAKEKEKEEKEQCEEARENDKSDAKGDGDRERREREREGEREREREAWRRTGRSEKNVRTVGSELSVKRRGWRERRENPSRYGNSMHEDMEVSNGHMVWWRRACMVDRD